MPVVKVFDSSAPNLTISKNSATRITFRFLAKDSQGNTIPIGGNTGVLSADLVIVPPGQPPITLPMFRRANGDLFNFINAGELTLDVGDYPYFIYLNGDQDPYCQGLLSIGIAAQNEFIVEVWDAARNTVLVDGSQLEDPAFASSDDIGMNVSTDSNGVQVIRLFLKKPITDVGVNIDGGRPDDIYPGLPVIDGGTP